MREIAVNYDPRTPFDEFHNRKQRWAAMLMHRRRGKTFACLHEIHTRALYTTKKKARYAYVAPYYSQAKDVAWEYLIEATEKSCVKARESELSVELFNGAKIILYGADNPKRMRGLYFDGVVIDEFGECRPSIWGSVILPTLADRGGWAVFIGTPAGKNHFYKICERAKHDPKWFFRKCTVEDADCPLGAEEIAEMRAIMSEEEFRRELMCDFDAPVPGTFYADQIGKMERGRIDGKAGAPQIGVFKHDPTLPVHVAQDLGYTDSTAIWFWQHTGAGIHVIDYEEHDGEMVDFYLKLLRRKPYRYETIWVPHDAKQKTLQTGRGTVEQYIEHFRNTDASIKIVPKLAVQHGIDAVRYMLPKCYIDAENCAEGIECLRAYKRKYDETQNCYSRLPEHNWASHGADAFRYLALVAKERVATATPGQIIHDSGLITTNLTLNQLFAEQRTKAPLNRHRL